jgi:peptide deformylase
MLTAETAWRRIVIADDRRLRTRCEPVRRFDDRTARLIMRLKETCEALNGYGLAAPQIGETVQVLVWRTSPQGSLRTVVNPQIVSVSGPTVVDVEECFSVPGVAVEMQRPSAATVRVRSADGSCSTLAVDGLSCRVLLHEIDHLHGRLTVDSLSRADRRRALKLMSKPV